jgi:hypothetical protein
MVTKSVEAASSLPMPLLLLLRKRIRPHRLDAGSAPPAESVRSLTKIAAGNEHDVAGHDASCASMVSIAARGDRKVTIECR